MIQIREEKKKNVLVIYLAGKLLGGPEAQELLEKLQQLIDAGEKNVLIHLREVERMNSSGLGILISAFTSFRNNGGQLVIVAPNDSVRKLMKITKLDSVFRILDTEEEALQ